ncbi:MAG TPA: glycosyltransferase [Solirubrobacteraceae bacterium]|nr:glycosyltransferase [Solirubrobacteraceae bacterium]
MRVLLVNKFFRPGAGAETSFLHTRRLLQERGHDVIDFAMRDDANLPSPYASFFAPSRSYAADVPLRERAAHALSSVYSPAARRAIARLLDAHRPDVAHLHNVYHQLTLSIVDELASRRVPIVLTMHDWKIACPAYTLFTEGEVCRRCPTGNVASAVRHRCVKSSAAASAIAATEAIVAHRRGSYEKVQRFIAPSRFAVGVAALAGVAEAKVTHIPNFLPDDELNVTARSDDAGARLLYAGRLEATKGIRGLLAAFARVRTPATLRIAGRGELEEEVRAAAAADPRISYLGLLPRDELYAEIDAARAVVLPSLYEDNGPLIILEAQARAKAMIVTDRGGPPEFVRHDETGLVVDPASPVSLAAAMERLAGDADLARTLGARAQQDVRREHSAARHYELLSRTYADAQAAVA